jgi:multidrug resistance efflux pump
MRIDGRERTIAPAPMSRLRRLVPLLLLLLCAVAYLAWRSYERHRPYEWSGTVEARAITLGSRAGGRVKEVLVHEGAHVAAGQPLVLLEAGDLEAQRLAAQGQLDQVKAALARAERGARPEEIAAAKARAASAQAALRETRTGARAEEIAAARARLAATQVAVDKAKVDAERARRLFAAAAVSQVEVDNADSAHRSAVAQRDALQQTLTQLENGARPEQIQQATARVQEATASAKLVESGSRIEDIAAARGAVDAAQGRLDGIEIMIGELTIRSPLPARVESLDLRPGDLVAPNAPAVTVVEDDQLYVRIYVPETHLGRIQVGQVVPVSVDSFPDRRFKGVVEHINSVGEYSPRNLQTADQRADQVFATRISLAEGRDQMRAGMAAFITVPK